jgi:threonine dehydrogenase-like Zn-dependent dehydrogenase
MKALCWHGKGDIRCDDVPDPKIEDGRDAIVKMTACAICGSDLHLMDGYIPFMEKGDVLGHEFMGEVVDVGPDNKKLKVGGSRCRPVHDLLRRMPAVPQRQLVGLRTLQPHRR